MTRKLYAGLAVITILALASLSIGLMPKEASAINTGKTGLLFPLYVSPGASWDAVIALKHNHPNLPIIIIANIGGGAGTSQSSTWVTGIQKMQAAGIKVLGYVPTKYSTRPLADREAEVAKWNTWYHVDGISFDEMANTAGHEQYYLTLKDYVHSLGMTIARGNPGTRTIESYYPTMDIINVYEGTTVPSASTLVSGNGAWTVKYDKGHFGATIKSDPTFDPASFAPVYPYLGWIYVTNTDWGNVPSYLEQEAVALDALNGVLPVVPPPVPQPLVPQPPTGLTASPVSTSQINLSWNAPTNNGGSAMTGYKIERSTDGGILWNIIISNTASTATSNLNTGLASSTTYTYRVSGINAIGTGSPSSSASATTFTTPTGIIQINNGKSSLSTPNWGSGAVSLVKFTGLTPGNKIDKVAINVFTAAGNIIYKVYQDDGVGGSASTLLAESNSFAVTAGTTYNSLNTSAIIPPSGNVWIGFQPDSNAMVAYYSLTTPGAHVWDFHTFGLGPNPYVVSGSNQYEFWAGIDVISSSVNTVPGAPTGLTANAISDSQINLFWTAPNNGGSAITGYKIERESPVGGGFSVLVANTGFTSTTYSNTGLTAGTQYNYRVSGINSVGTGLSSTSASTIPPVVQPPVTGTDPVLVTVKSVDLSQNPITGMWAVIRNPDGTTITQGYTPVSFSVAPGQTYVVHVGNYNQRIFNHWNDGTTISYDTITPEQNIVLTAYYTVPPA